MAQLASYQYGKDLVRFLRVVRDPTDPSSQQVAEYTVRCLLTGSSLATSYTQADNTLIVPTDTIKNTVNVLAKSLDGANVVLVPERFALHVADHFLRRYAHVDGVEVDVDSLRWSRIDLGAEAGGPHKHSFVRDGDSVRTAKVVMHRSATDTAGAGEFVLDTLQGGVKNLLVLKSSGSAFHGYHVDELTTLKPVQDRVFSTAIECTYTIDLPGPLSSFIQPSPFSYPPSGTKSAVPSSSPSPLDFNALHARILAHTLRLFATDASASVQATLFKMAQATLEDSDEGCTSVSSVEYTLPNKHYVPVDLGFVGLGNLGESEAEVFLPQANPSGLIKAKVVRAAAGKGTP
ncbi:unnamed protein product [Tilletia laevis]|uniref:Uricase n=2 Tax=Tilletia TaxID=13289 RepID=A0A177TA34_9BASI|nr:hypothetical protein CF336_g8029 [Tilletia laevis]KAE8242768.1 hypothetical protein A4X03_0g7973 [Tilletia caries]CAD6922736.1 unnamed protein product [Tilletia controversa]KAE8184335.1 hypothetical protein CF335_g8055 [Tilletia laevis]CAD6884222.1 unnamed protein product [Tilletia caries]